MKQIKYFFYILIFLISSSAVFAQNNTISPYSKLGLGDFETMGFGWNTALGGSGIALRTSITLNNLNPAAISALDSTSVIFEVGVHGDYTHLKTMNQSGGKKNANLSYMALGLGITSKWGMSFGLVPYSNVGYTFETLSPISGTIGNYRTKYEGSGGLSKFFFTNAYNVTKDISLGVNFSFLFGPKNDIEYYGLPNTNYYEITQQLSTKYRGFVFDFGYQQTLHLNNNNKLTFGLTINAPGKLQYKSTLFVSQRYSESGSIDTLKYDPGLYRSTVYPVNYGGGLAYNYNTVLTLSADYSLQNWSELVISDDFSDMSNNQTLAVGVEFIPKRLSHRSPITYRSGLNYQSGSFVIDGQHIDRLAFTAGLGFKLRTMRINVYGAYSTRGTTNNQLIQEDLFRVGLNVSFYETWLQRRRYR